MMIRKDERQSVRNNSSVLNAYENYNTEQVRLLKANDKISNAQIREMLFSSSSILENYKDRLKRCYRKMGAGIVIDSLEEFCENLDMILTSLDETDKNDLIMKSIKFFIQTIRLSIHRTKDTNENRNQ